MLYHDFQECKLSALGLGCMRLPVVNGEDNRIDQNRLNEMVDEALSLGINYFDTAYLYHGGSSEPAVGEALRRHPRESYFLATKFPSFKPEFFETKEEIFEEQLRRCGVDYFDFYLCHNVAEKNVDDFLSEEHGLIPYLLEQKRLGRIRHLGFSTHGSLDMMRRFLRETEGQMEFCQIQLNWLDWSYQNAWEKVDILNEFGLPIWVMEPVRGGRLAKLSDAHSAALASLRPDESIPGWCFRFLQSVPGVTMVLSGMSNMEQLQENARIWSDTRPLSAEENAALLAIGAEMEQSMEAPCTACRYCVEGCPKGLDIPALLKLYNENCLSGERVSDGARNEIPAFRGPQDCIACRHCEAVCPQQIRIAGVMADFAKKLHG